jgi:hypothetical protein
LLAGDTAVLSEVVETDSDLVTKLSQGVAHVSHCTHILQREISDVCQKLATALAQKTRRVMELEEELLEREKQVSYC